MIPGNGRESSNFGGKIFLPPSALNRLTMLNISYPMLFELHSEETDLKTFGGVLEFIAEEGRVYIPQWMMESLAVSPGSIIKITNTNLALGSFVKIEPQSTDFLDISDPKAVLENALRSYSTLTLDDIFQISYNDKIYSIKVLEVKPENDKNSICVVETDLEVDFAPPVGYIDNSHTATPLSAQPNTPISGVKGTMASSINYSKLVQEGLEQKKRFDPFTNKGQKLSGKNVTTSSNEISTNQEENITEDLEREFKSVSAAPLNLPFGQLFFGYHWVPLKNLDEEKERENEDQKGNETSFTGMGNSLRKNGKKKP